MEEALHGYEAALEAERRLVTEERHLARLLSPDCDDSLFARWFLRFGAHSLYLTRYDGWWLPGERRRYGRSEPGPSEKTPDADRPGHESESMQVGSVRATADWWRDRHGERLDVDVLLRMPPLAGAEFYVRLCENVVHGPAPCCGAAIAYEVGRCLVTIGPALLANCRRVFGGDSGCFDFLAVQTGRHGDHLKSWRRHLESCLTDHPALLRRMVDTGKTALVCFAVFLAECWDLARADLEMDGGGR
ncbi:hypothetical protein [Microbispora triticiradicis]|uniref:hypothetical protein n=1 Tax=Microbispora triticiradicis TaxID=2200763 RepID=UPI001AD680C6|nr:hypothetical protein [Microbispora triticiradicis]MBO4271860.1 hypothetical protein [Microbispora triticiradicis]